MHVASGKQQDGVTVYDSASGVAEQGAIGVAVKGHAEIELALHFADGLGDVLRMEGATAFVDVLSVRLGVEEGGLDSASLKKFWSFRGGCSVGTVHENLEPAQVGGNIVREPVDIGSPQAGGPGQTGRIAFAGLPARSRTLQVSKNFLLNCQLAFVRKLISIAGKNFDSVISPGIVRRGDHYTGIESARTGEIGNAGRGDDAGTFDRNAM